ncbi:MAG: 3-deoxy-manno-octulosonate cytidylyltransferase (CMP-KDO synthetase) [Paraglaciecola sp.]|jgi:3-deoxy-manno-octulosonate cytidylyltransferase (CMP-KDO synthetase)
MSFKIAIPARYQSSRLPGKPLADIHGNPMIWHVYQQACKTGVTQQNIVIATDNQEIFDCASNFGANVVMTSAEHKSGTDRLAEVAQQLNWRDSDVVVNVQGDEPLIPPALIAQVANLVINNQEVGMSTLGVRLTALEDVVNPNVVKLVTDNDKVALYFSRAAIPFDRDSTIAEQLNSSSASPYIRHIGMYAYRVNVLNQLATLPVCQLEQLEKLEQLRALSNGIKIKVGVIEQAPAHGVDTQQDLEKVRALLAC